MLLPLTLGYDFSRTYNLIQDDASNLYFFEMFVGSKLEKVNLLVDTQASGTAIKYDTEASRRSIVHKTLTGTVEMPDGHAEGYDATD